MDLNKHSLEDKSNQNQQSLLMKTSLKLLILKKNVTKYITVPDVTPTTNGII